MRDFFIDKKHQAHYEKNGYVKVQLVPPARVNQLLHDCRQYVEYREGFYTLVDDGLAPDSKREVLDLIIECCEEAAQKILRDFTLIKGTFLNKTKSATGNVLPHQDWSFVDENEFRSFNVWMPLVATTKENGALHLVPGTHQLHNNPRAVPISIGSYGARRHADLMRKHGVLVETQPGEAIIMDSKVVHYSFPNLTDQERVVAGSLWVPAEAPTHHYCFNREGKKGLYDLCRVDREVLLRLAHDELATKTEVTGQIPVPEYPDADVELRNLFYPSLITQIRRKLQINFTKRW